MDKEHLRELFDARAEEMYQTILGIGNGKVPIELVEQHLLFNSHCCRAELESAMTKKDCLMLAVLGGYVDFPEYFKRQIENAEVEWNQRLAKYAEATEVVKTESATCTIDGFGEVPLGTWIKTDVTRGLREGSLVGVNDGRVTIQGKSGTKKSYDIRRVSGVG